MFSYAARVKALSFITMETVIPLNVDEAETSRIIYAIIIPVLDGVGSTVLL